MLHRLVLIKAEADDLMARGIMLSHSRKTRVGWTLDTGLGDLSGLIHEKLFMDEPLVSLAPLLCLLVTTEKYVLLTVSILRLHRPSRVVKHKM